MIDVNECREGFVDKHSRARVNPPRMGLLEVLIVRNGREPECEIWGDTHGRWGWILILILLLLLLVLLLLMLSLIVFLLLLLLLF